MNNQSFYAAVGWSKLTQSDEAVRQAVESAMHQFDQKPVSLVILFYSRFHDASQIIETLRQRFDTSVQIIGGVSPGLITHDVIAVDEHLVGVALLGGEKFSCQTLVSETLTDNEKNVGKALAKQLNQSVDDGAQTILLYDSVKQSVSEGKPALHHATPLLHGFVDELQTHVALSGIGMLADPGFQSPAGVIANDEVQRHKATLTQFFDGIRIDSIILHGCSPSSGYHTITSASGPVVHEIDNMPAVEFVRQQLGPDSGLEPGDYPLFITLGINRGDLYEEFDPDNYANRLCLAVDEESGSLVMFEPDLVPGTKVQLMKRSLGMSYIAEKISSAFHELSDREIIFAFYLDCLGRWSQLCGTEEEEARLVADAIGSDVPLLGIYSGVEIAPVRSYLQPLDWTGVLCLFSVEK
jgi:hypothetical protein